MHSLMGGIGGGDSPFFYHDKNEINEISRTNTGILTSNGRLGCLILLVSHF